MNAAPLDELVLYLRPPGQGIYTVSSGKQELEEFTKRYLGNEQETWRNHLEKLSTLSGKSARVLVAIPSDAGAGFMRGASLGPQGMREAFGHAPVFDCGDVFCVPHFIEDDMLSAAQRYASQDALYAAIPLPERRSLPVSPMSITLRVLQLIKQINPEIKVHILGGDHTCAWPMSEFLFADSKDRTDQGIIHFDAHTDMLSERLGVKYCFGTWAYHANELLGRNGRLVQIGIRASAKPQSYWEEEFGVKQLWAKDALLMAPEELGSWVVQYLSEKGISRVYISNDIDGTDSYWASACGTPEPNGLTPEHVLAVIAAVRDAGIVVLSADLVELAPGLSLSEEASARSVATAVSYVKAQLEAF